MDNYIPYSSAFIIPYVLFFPYVILTIFLLWQTNLASLLLWALILTTSLANLFWYLFPNGVKREKITGNSVLDRLAKFVHTFDGETNAFPSSHVFSSLICTFYLSIAFPDIYIVFVVVGVAISISTLYTKQHYFVDILGGIMWFCLSVLFYRIVS